MPLRACAECGRLSKGGHCEEHQPKPWQTRTAGKRLRGAALQKRNRRLFAYHGGICHWCGRPGATEIDHVIGLAQGGTDSEANLRPIHHDCNLEKMRVDRRRAQALPAKTPTSHPSPT